MDYRALPKAVVHDHLDGGLRVSTILELADEHGYAHLPASTEDDLAAWFHQGRSGSLERYLEEGIFAVALSIPSDSARERLACLFDLTDNGMHRAYRYSQRYS